MSGNIIKPLPLYPMKDLFYIILFVWLIWRLLKAFSSDAPKPKTNSENTSQKTANRVGETTVQFVPPKTKPINDDAGEYVDYEEVK